MCQSTNVLYKGIDHGAITQGYKYKSIKEGLKVHNIVHILLTEIVQLCRISLTEGVHSEDSNKQTCNGVYDGIYVTPVRYSGVILAQKGPVRGDYS